MSEINLREVTKENLVEILKVKTKDSQKGLVAMNAVSIAQAHYHEEAWFRGIYAGDTAVGFVMLSDKPEEPEYFLWRFMIGEEFQGKGYGAQALELLKDYVRTRPNATELMCSIIEREDGPREFYEKQGFVSLDKYDEGELIMSCQL